VEGQAPRGLQPPLRLSRQHLGNMTGTTQESVNKQWHAFVAKGLITLEQGRVRIVDRAGLEVDGDAFS